MNKLNKEEMKSKSNQELAQHRTEIAEDRTELAQLRNELAENRTLQAAERTYAAWVRTGFTIAGAGWTLAQALQSDQGRNLALLLGGTLIILGLMCFVYAWLGFKSVYDYLQATFDDEDNTYPFTMNLTTVTILSVVLFVVFVIAFATLLF